MISAMVNHLWQSTLIVAVAWLLSLALRKEGAEVRYGLWFSASCKFFIPFSLLVSLGKHIGWTSVLKAVATPAVSIRLEQFTQPFPEASAAASRTAGNFVDWIPLISLAVWICGFGLITLMRLRAWRRIRAVVASSFTMDLLAPVEIRSSPGLLEPGVVGLFHPMLLLPAGIVEQLTTRQLEAVLAHELCHVKRRDNLTSTIHMVVEALFWFYPLVWCIGRKLVEERERACDEAVLRLGNEPQVYAEGILHFCKTYLASPLSCVSGVTGSDLKRRIQAILAGSAPRELTSAKKWTLTAAGIAALCVPIVFGIVNVPPMRAQSAVLQNAGTFAEVSIQPCAAFRKSSPNSWSPGVLRSECTTVQRLIEQAYGLFATGQVNPGSWLTVAGGPEWTTTDLYEIDAKTPGSESRGMMNGPMMQALLEDRFKLKIHRESREVPVYALTVMHGGPILEPFRGTCNSRDFDDPPTDADCGTARGFGSGFDLNAATMADLCAALLVFLDRPVVDETGTAGRFNLKLDLSPEDPSLLNRPRSLPALSDPTKPATPPVHFEAAKRALNILGLDLEAAKRPGEFLVIDSVERPDAR